ncbi:hypothetical protein [Enterococcus sp. DIV0876]
MNQEDNQLEPAFLGAGFLFVHFFLESSCIVEKKKVGYKSKLVQSKNR